MSGGRSGTKRRSTGPRRRPQPAVASTAEERLQQDWWTSRSGARSARGFHFQDAVGAWLAAEVAGGSLAGVLVPEGLDDMELEGASGIAIQIKSRVDRVGPFSTTDAAKHIVATWSANQRRSDPSTRVWVVLENGVSTGEVLQDVNQALDVALAAGAPLRRAVAQLLADELPEANLAELLTTTVVLAPTWSDLDTWTDRHLEGLTTVPKAGRDLITRSLRLQVSDATDFNGNPDRTQRVVLDRTSIITLINAAAEQIDVERLEAALRDGLCVPLDWQLRAGEGDRFYQGVATQPGHVTSGLVVARKDLLADVLRAMDQAQPVVITGPSGVGKSALLWTVPQALPGVTWFRVQRLQSAADANLLMRLARAYGASSEHPVGFLLDGIGAGQLTAWAALRSHASTQSGLLLVATARNEDLVGLGELAGTVTVAVVLDENAAATIYEGLKKAGATDQPYWREAYEQSNGLTLEYTYLLTQGRRLHDVIADQVQQRITDGREAEYELLTLVATAGQWSTTLELDRVMQALEATPFGVRSAIGRLADEHLLAEVDGILSGLHPVRSAAISAAIHGTPPPTLVSTFARLLGLVDDRQLPRFIAQALRQHPELSEHALAVAAAQRPTATRLAAHLHGLRLADTEAEIRQWIQIMEEEGVAPALRLTTAMMAVARIDLRERTRPEVREALTRMGQVRPGTLRDQLADSIGPKTISELVFGSDPETARMLVAAMVRWPSTVQLPPTSESSALVEQLGRTDLPALAETLATLEDHDRELWVSVIEALGGEDRMLDEIRRQCPWLLDLDIRPGDDGPVGFARLLHLSDEHQGGARERCVALAQVLLRLLPSIQKPDVEALRPGRVRLQIGGLVDGMSELLRSYDHSETEVAWNQARLATARVLLGAPDSIRLNAAYPLLVETATFLREFGCRWVRGELTPARLRAMAEVAARLDHAGALIRPSLGSPQLESSVTTPRRGQGTAEPLATLISNCASLPRRYRDDAGKPYLSAFVREHIQKTAHTCLAEPWLLIAEGDQAIDQLQQIISDCHELAAVLGQLQARPDAAPAIHDVARKVSALHALHHCGKDVLRTRTAEVDARKAAIAATVASVSGATVEVLADDREGIMHYAALVPVPSLFRWYELHADIIAALEQIRVAGEQYLILPLRNGKRVEGWGVSLIITPLPAVDIGEWRPLLPEAHILSLEPIVAAVIDNLVLLSGLTDLSPAQLEHPDVDALARLAGQAFTTAFQQLSRQPGELTPVLLGELEQALEKLQSDREAAEPDPTFAAGVWRGVTGEPTAEAQLVQGMKLCAIEWEIEPDVVREELRAQQ